jgi:hypothetical protein
MYHWNSQKLEQDLAQLPGIAAVENRSFGGDVDTDNLVLEIDGCEDCLYIRGFTTQDYDRKTMKPYELPNRNDVDIEMVEVSDGLCYSGGLNSTQPEMIRAYAEVRVYLANDGADVVDQLKDYF